jgi:hypothetical protein
MVSFTLAATGPDRSADWPITIWACTPGAAMASRSAAAQDVNVFFIEQSLSKERVPVSAGV